MGRFSMATKLWRHNVKDDEDEGIYVLLYSFEGTKPNPKFWNNLKKLKEYGGEDARARRNAFIVDSKRCALSVKKLVEHFGGNVISFKGYEVELELEKDEKVLMEIWI